MIRLREVLRVGAFPAKQGSAKDLESDLAVPLL
jgi:hypothetical protein